MKVEKLREIFEVQDIAELKPDTKYLIRCKDRMSLDCIERIQKSIEASGIKAVFCGPELEFYEIKD
jgi:hypothetical protein